MEHSALLRPYSGMALWWPTGVVLLLMGKVEGYLARKKTPPPPRTTIGS